LPGLRRKKDGKTLIRLQFRFFELKRGLGRQRRRFTLLRLSRGILLSLILGGSLPFQTGKMVTEKSILWEAGMSQFILAEKTGELLGAKKGKRKGKRNERHMGFFSDYCIMVFLAGLYPAQIRDFHLTEA